MYAHTDREDDSSHILTRFYLTRHGDHHYSTSQKTKTTPLHTPCLCVSEGEIAFMRLSLHISYPTQPLILAHHITLRGEPQAAY